jgi:hypothetical protein
MKLSLKLMVTAVLAFSNLSHAQLNTGVEVITTNEIYCVHSELRVNGNLQNTSNIFCLKGTSDTIWIFSMGYGDAEDLKIYRDCTTITTSLQQDIRLIDSVAGLMGLVNPKPMVILCHFHLDHANQDLWHGLDSIFGIMDSYLYIHIADYSRCTCNSLCCGVTPCVQSSSYFGSPFDKKWTTPTLARFRTLGNKNNSCGHILKYITTPSGNWRITKSDNAHTGGCVNLEHPGLQYRINGADILSTCFPPIGWTSFNIHGDCF